MRNNHWLCFHCWLNANHVKDMFWFLRVISLRWQLYFQKFLIFLPNLFADVSLLVYHFLLHDRKYLFNDKFGYYLKLSWLMKNHDYHHLWFVQSDHLELTLNVSNSIYFHRIFSNQIFFYDTKKRSMEMKKRINPTLQHSSYWTILRFYPFVFVIHQLQPMYPIYSIISQIFFS